MFLGFFHGVDVYRNYGNYYARTFVGFLVLCFLVVHFILGFGLDLSDSCLVVCLLTGLLCVLKIDEQLLDVVDQEEEIKKILKNPK